MVLSGNLVRIQEPAERTFFWGIIDNSIARPMHFGGIYPSTGKKFSVMYEKVFSAIRDSFPAMQCPAGVLGSKVAIGYLYFPLSFQ